MHFAGPTWHQSRDGSVLLASLRYNGSGSRKTKGGLADTLQCNIWRRAQTAHRMTHSLFGSGLNGNHNGFTALGKKIGTSAPWYRQQTVLHQLMGHVLVLRPCQEAPDWLRFKFALSLYHVCTLSIPVCTRFILGLRCDCFKFTHCISRHSNRSK